MLEQKITTVIITGNSGELKEITSSFEKIDEISVVGTATTQKNGLKLIHSYAPQLLIISVELEDFSGLDFVKDIYQKSILPEVVFVASDEYTAYDTLVLRPLDFLVTPIAKNEVHEMLKRLKLKLKRDELKRKMDIYARFHDVTVKRVFPLKRGIVVLQLDEIVCCKSERSRTILTLANDEEIEVRSNLTESIEIINNQSFFRISRSYCINRNYLRKIDKKNTKCLLHFDGQTCEVPASRNIIRRLESLYTKPLN